MGCPRGNANPSNHTKLRLFAASGGYCQNPKCLKKLFLSVSGHNIHVAEIAHVFSANDQGPRANKLLSKAERGAFDNLILLCPLCHTIIDKASDEYPDEILKNWKLNHTRQIDSIFLDACASRKDLRMRLTPLLAQNKTIFEEYGPLTIERFNPESNLPIIWQHKILTQIIPNNRKILGLLDSNRQLLTPPEQLLTERFRQHVEDFELKHVGGRQESGIRFPSALNSILESDS
jgi:hypothetical protein